jgi:hypothetical protein
MNFIVAQLYYISFVTAMRNFSARKENDFIIKLILS